MPEAPISYAAHLPKRDWQVIGKCALVALGSSGWVLPMWLAVESCLGWYAMVTENRGNSFPYGSAASVCFRIAFAWLGIVIAVLSFVAARRLMNRTPLSQLTTDN